MPTYEYECTSCGHCFEAFQKIKDDALSECPECGAGLKRLIGGGSGFIMKGGGATASSAAPRCGQATPCCGRETRCDKPPCGD